MPYYIDSRRLHGGFDVDVNATRCSNYYHVERDLVHILGGWIARVPELAVKIGLGTHVWEDAEHVTQLRQRIKELRYPSEYPRMPDERLIRLTEAINRSEDTLLLLVGVYQVLKPHLMTSYRLHRAMADPIIDEPGTRLFARLAAEETEQVCWGRALIEELKRTPADHDRALVWQRQLEHMLAEIGEIGTLPLAKGRRKVGLTEDRLLRPAKESFVQILPGGDPLLKRDYYDVTKPVSTDGEDLKHFLHSLVQAEIQAAEVMGRNIADYPDMPWEFHHAMARQAWDEVRHATIMVKQLESWGVRWGDYPIGQGTERYLSHDLFGRLVVMNHRAEGGASPRHIKRRDTLRAAGQHDLARIFDYLLADEGLHIHNGVTWSRWLCDNDEERYKARLADLDAQLAARAASAKRPAQREGAATGRDRVDVTA